jgi:hypothetical protein
MIRQMRAERLWPGILAAVSGNCVAPSMPPDRVAPAAAGAPSAVPAREPSPTARIANTPVASRVPGGGERIADKSPRSPEVAPSLLDNGAASVGSRAAALFGKWTGALGLDPDHLSSVGVLCADARRVERGSGYLWDGRVLSRSCPPWRQPGMPRSLPESCDALDCRRQLVWPGRGGTRHWKRLVFASCRSHPQALDSLNGPIGPEPTSWI